MPAISVILPVYNQEEYIKTAVDSILNQCYNDFELIVVNDGSTDNTLNILDSFTDTRIKIIDSKQNCGIIKALNSGINSSSDSKYIARMDSDDICYPNRFAVQKTYLDNNEEVGITGSFSTVFSKLSKSHTSERPRNHIDILSTFITLNPISHPTVMLRTKLLQGGNLYDSNYPKYEDYALWISLIGKCNFHNISESLLYYRRHQKNITKTYNDDITSDYIVFKKLISTYLEKVQIELSETQIHVLCVITSRNRFAIDNNISISDINDLIMRILSQINTKKLNPKLVEELLVGQVQLYLLQSKRLNHLIKFNLNISDFIKGILGLHKISKWN